MEQIGESRNRPARSSTEAREPLEGDWKVVCMGGAAGARTAPSRVWDTQAQGTEGRRAPAVLHWWHVRASAPPGAGLQKAVWGREGSGGRPGWPVHAWATLRFVLGPGRACEDARHWQM